MIAVKHSWDVIVKILLSRKADLRIQNSQGKTAINFANYGPKLNRWQVNILTLLKKFCKWFDIEDTINIPIGKFANYEKEEDLKMEIGALIIKWLWGDFEMNDMSPSVSPMPSPEMKFDDALTNEDKGDLNF